MKILLFILLGVFFIGLHALIALYIDRLNYHMYQKSTNFELVPFTNVYLLGKLAFNRVVGAILFVVLFFVVPLTITLFGDVYGISILVPSFRNVLFVIYLLVIIAILIYAIYKYNKMTDNQDRFKIYDIIYFVKETLWIVVFFISVYLFLLFVKSASK